MTAPMVPDDESVELTMVANDVIRAIDSLRQEISSQKKYGRRNRMLIWAVSASVALDLLLSIALFALFRKADEAARVAKGASSAQVVSCRAGNEARALQTELWETILSYPPKPGESAAEERLRVERTDQFRAYIKDAFAQQDCEKLVRQ